MHLRLTFARRLALILWPGLILLWLLANFVSIYSDQRFAGSALPLPRQLAALVHVLEDAPAVKQELILAAVTSPQFSARIDSGDTVHLASAGNRPLVFLQYGMGRLSELSPRPVSVTYPREQATFLMARLVSPVQFDIRIGLKTGNTLVVRTRAVLSASMINWPQGFGMGLIGILVSALVIYAMNREIRPLVRLAHMVDKIDPAFEIPAFPNDRKAAPEIQALIGAFTRLQIRLTGLLRSRMALIGGVSHDVRTFATRLRLRVEQIGDAAERGRAITDIEDMIALLDDAVTASRATAGELAEELLDLAGLAGQEVSDRQSHGAAVRLVPTLEPAEILVLADRLALRRVLSNLIENALKYGSRAAVQVGADAGLAILTIDDEGPGIPAGQRQALLEPFVRLEASRSRATGGAGLGLAVVHSIVRAHNGELSISDAPGGGARITVVLPVFQPQ